MTRKPSSCQCRTTSTALGLTADTDGGGEAAVDAEHDGLGGGGDDGKSEPQHGVVASHHHADREHPEAGAGGGRHAVTHPPRLVRRLRGEESPLPVRRLQHQVDVNLLPRQRRHVQRPVAEPSRQNLVAALRGDDVVAPVVCRPVPDLDARPLLQPLLSGLVGYELAALARRGAPLPGRLGELTQQERDRVRGLPETGVEEVGKGGGREVCQTVGAVERVVQPLAAPPALLDHGGGGV